MEAAPSVVILTHMSQLRPTELKYISTELKMSSAVVLVRSSLCREVVIVSPRPTHVSHQQVKLLWLLSQ